jgi:hypothetical protein
LLKEVPETKGIFSDRPVGGWIEREHAIFFFRASLPTAQRPVVRVRWEPRREGTLIHCQLGLGPLGCVSMATLAAIVAVAWIACVGAWIGDGFAVRAAGALALALAFTVVGPIALLVMRQMTVGDDDRLIRFVASTTNAQSAVRNQDLEPTVPSQAGLLGDGE